MKGNVYDLPIRPRPGSWCARGAVCRIPAEAPAIRSRARSRRIRYVYHFTRARNLESILSHGLLARNELLKANIAAPLNDQQRIDGRTDRVSLSIGFPNHCLFKVYRQRFAADTWALLRLNASILWTLDCCFIPMNASSSRVRGLEPASFRGADALEALFADWTPTRMERTPAMREYWPTDVQAEVMVQARVPSRLIEKVIFEVPSAAVPFRSRVPWSLLEYSRRWFGVRC